MKNNDHAGGWEVFEDRVLLETPVASIRSGPVLCKRSGRRKDFLFFDFPDWVNVVALTPDRRIILIKQFRYGSRRVEIEIPGGMINRGEPPVAAGCRELLEETGYSGENGRIIGKVCPNPAIQKNYCYTVLLENVAKSAEPEQDEMEDIETFLASEEEVRDFMATGSIEHGLVLNAFMFYQNEKGRTTGFL